MTKARQSSDGRKFIGRLRSWAQGRSGATLFEYAILVAIISIAGILMLKGIGVKSNDMMTPVSNGFQ